jgi:hypothetical protein
MGEIPAVNPAVLYEDVLLPAVQQENNLELNWHLRGQEGCIVCRCMIEEGTRSFLDFEAMVEVQNGKVRSS